MEAQGGGFSLGSNPLHKFGNPKNLAQNARRFESFLSQLIMNRLEKIELANQVIKYAQALEQRGIEKYDAFYEAVETFGK